MLLAYDDNGPGPVVVLLHGFPFDRTLWSAQSAEIGSVYRVIAPDLRGHGETAAPDGVYTIDAMADDVMELLDALQLTEPVVLGGHSMGGYIALSAALRYPERFRGLILVDTRAGADAPEAARHRVTLAEQVERTGSTAEVVEGMLPKLFSAMTRERRPQAIDRMHDVMVRTNPRAVAGALRGMAERPDRTGALVRLNLPTLVIVGSDDAITPPTEARAMAEAIPGARLEVIPDAGHVAPVEDPEAVNRVILDFLGRLCAPAATASAKA
jgi:pimeloyl-ACP methyl ester carboxylesterase